MRRWNGWGDDSEEYPLGDDARAFLLERVGPSQPPTDATQAQALAAVPASRIANGGLLQTDPRLRLLHARGQSFPDWVAMKAGRFGPVADAVALPTSHEEAAAALDAAQKLGAIVVPYGGGTSVVGHLGIPAGDRPVVNISLERMNRLMAVDEQCLLATLGAGTPGPMVEAQLARHRRRLGGDAIFRPAILSLRPHREPVRGGAPGDTERRTARRRSSGLLGRA